MDIRRLEAFAKVYELGSFSKAAGELYLSQPTVSTHIAALESELGVVLFDRMGRRVLPTQAAEVLYGYAGRVFDNIEAARAEVAALQERIAGEFALGGSTIPAHYLLPDLVAEFRRGYPEVRITLRVGDTEEIAGMVANGDLMCGLVGAELDRPDLEFTRLFEDQMAIIATPGFVKEDGEVPAEALLRYPWVMRESGSGTRRALEAALNASGLELSALDAAVIVESTQAVIQFVRAGLGVSATSRIAAAEYLETGRLVEIPVRGLAMERWFYLVRHHRRHFFPAVRRFIDFLEQRGSGPSPAQPS
jgi:DNA-binding transcriptional LysR family regulator